MIGTSAFHGETARDVEFQVTKAEEIECRSAQIATPEMLVRRDRL
jgi:hypothetical protein